MKIYRFTYGYRELKDGFFRELSKAVDSGKADRNAGMEIFVAMRLLLEDEKNLFPFWEHSRWVMINHTSKAAFLAAILWGYVLERLWSKEIVVFNRYPLSQIESRILVVSLIVAFVLISYRLHRVSLDVIRDANLVYLKYVLKNKARVVSSTMDGLGKQVTN